VLTYVQQVASQKATEYRLIYTWFHLILLFTTTTTTTIIIIIFTLPSIKPA
jgi:hypothetical protein